LVVDECNIPQLTQLVSVGLCNGASPRKLTEVLHNVFEGVIKYTPHPSIETRTLDLSVISYNLGGCKLLYVMSHRLCLPSLHTLRRHMAFTHVMPTIGTISVVDIIHNIKEVVLKPRDATRHTKLRRVSMMIDEVALEERAIHFRHTNSVGGLCWCHSTLVDLVLKTYEGVLVLAKAIKDGKVHLAKEMTVVVASCFGESGTYLILTLPSCKHVNAEDSGTIYEVVTAAWDTLGLGADKVGPIWSWATDSDMRHRVSGYKHFLAQTLCPTSPIYGTLVGMAGLNLYTGMNKITLDFDFKHIFKCMLPHVLNHLRDLILSNSRILHPPAFTS
ncbi:hypothetical protein B0H10DRAFT_1853421, partial [Mycena sp. CBHHK59/15]